MQLTCTKRAKKPTIYIMLDTRYEEKSRLKSAGFRWHPVSDKLRLGMPVSGRPNFGSIEHTDDYCDACRKGLPKGVWWTDDVVVAQRMADYADDDAKAELDARPPTQMELDEARALTLAAQTRIENIQREMQSVRSQLQIEREERFRALTELGRIRQQPNTELQSAREEIQRLQNQVQTLQMENDRLKGKPVESKSETLEEQTRGRFANLIVD